MKHDLLNAYKKYLLERYQPSTAQTYHKKLCSLFEGQSFYISADNLDVDKILSILKTIKHKNQFSQHKNAFFRFCEFMEIDLSTEVINAIEQLEKGTRKKRRKLKAVEFSLIDKKIKHIRNKKLKLSYQTILATGLRVSELASIVTSDCTITYNDITFEFIGKGGNKESVMIEKLEHSKLYHNLKENITTIPHDTKIFYSANYLQRKAKDLGFTCHDLRRAFAKLEYKKHRSKAVVMKKLRHSNIKTTNIYLRSKVKL